MVPRATQRQAFQSASSQLKSATEQGMASASDALAQVEIQVSKRTKLVSKNSYL